MTPDDLERLIAAELRALPAPTAPLTLARRVKTAVSADRAPVRPWAVWPHLWQTAFVLGMVVLAASAVLLWQSVAANATGVGWVQLSLQTVVDATDAVGHTEDLFWSALATFRALLLTPAVLAVVVLISGAALACACLGTWLGRVARLSLTCPKGVTR